MHILLILSAIILLLAYFAGTKNAGIFELFPKAAFFRVQIPGFGVVGQNSGPTRDDCISLCKGGGILGKCGENNCPTGEIPVYFNYCKDARCEGRFDECAPSVQCPTASLAPSLSFGQCGTDSTCDGCQNYGLGNTKAGCDAVWWACKNKCTGGGVNPPAAPPNCIENGQSGCFSPGQCCNPGGGCNGGCCGHCKGGGGGGGCNVNGGDNACVNYPCQSGQSPYCADTGDCKCH